MKAAVLALFLAIAVASLSSAYGQQYLSYVAQLNGRNSIPNVINTAANAIFTLNVDVAKQEAYYTFRINSVVDYTMSHIHLANATSNGAPIVLLWPGMPSGSQALTPATLPTINPPADIKSMVLRGTVTPSSIISVTKDKPLTWGGFISSLNSGNLYVNIHTTKYPAGEIRGQVAANGKSNMKFANE